MATTITKFQRLLAGTVVVDGITASDFAVQPLVARVIGKLTKNDLRAMSAQAVKTAGQPNVTKSNTTGFGRYGFSSAQLEQVGYLKKGTTARYVQPSGNAVSALGSPLVWTGKNGIKNLNDLLVLIPSKQDFVQFELYLDAYEYLNLRKLKLDNISVTDLPAEELGGLLQGAAKFGPSVVHQWAQELPLLPNFQSQITQIKTRIRMGNYAVHSVKKFSNNVKNISDTTNVLDTVNTQNVANTVAAIVGSAKVDPRAF